MNKVTAIKMPGKPVMEKRSFGGKSGGLQWEADAYYFGTNGTVFISEVDPEDEKSLVNNLQFEMPEGKQSIKDLIVLLSHTLEKRDE